MKSAMDAAAQSYRVGQKVEASIIAGGVSLVPATIVEAGQGARAGKYRVRFEDGRTDWRDPRDEIRPLASAPPAPQASPAPRRAGAMPGSLPTGEYQCFYAAANAFDADVPGSHAASYMVSFQVLNASTYRYTTGTKLTGRYRYAPGTGRITWLSGSLGVDQAALPLLPLSRFTLASSLSRFPAAEPDQAGRVSPPERSLREHAGRDVLPPAALLPEGWRRQVGRGK